MFSRVHARRIGFVCVVIAGIWCELSPWGERVSKAVLDVQLLVLSRWAPRPAAGDEVVAGFDTGTPESAGVLAPPALRPLSRVVVMCLVFIGALVWWESRLAGWAVASSLAALAALLATSTMMLQHAVMVPTAGTGTAIMAAVLGRRALEAAIASRDRRREEGE